MPSAPDIIGRFSACPSCSASTAPTAAKPDEPMTSGNAWRNWATVSTPSTWRICSATLGENGVPTALDRMNCEVRVFSMAWSVLAFAERPRIDMRATRVRPIMRALAVAAVRRGLRIEFCAASCPTVPKARR